MTLKRARAGLPDPLAVTMRFTVLALLIAGIVEAQRFGGEGYWGNSGWFWASLAALVAATIVVAWRARERGYLERESALAYAVRDRTADLERERHRERERNRILEMLVSNEPLESVLDEVLQGIRSQCRGRDEEMGALCAILRKSGDHCQVLAALDVPGEWLTALRVPRAVPFEAWRMPLSDQRPSTDPAWSVFASRLKGPIPGIICSRPIRNTESPPGLILLFYPEGTAPGEFDVRASEMGERMARLAIEQNRLYESLHFQACHDGLTGLPNRALFEERLDRSLLEAGTPGKRFAVLFVDVDRFKLVNDTFSHRVGDLCLCEIASRMKRTLRPIDTLARVGGDEFMIVLNDMKEVSEASEVAGRLLDAIRQPLIADGHEIGASASIGIAIFPDDGAEAEVLQRAADAAMYCAKNLGRDRAEAFATRNETLDRVRMHEEVRVALRERYFVVHYQPKVDPDRKLAGFEALVRMNHPVHGLIPPMSFIPVAESSGLIVPLGAWVLDEACRQIAEWQARSLSPVSVAVNVSPVQICRSDFAKSVTDCLTRHGIAASSLELELTESLLINAAGVAQEQLRQLRALGVLLSIDDFGTGYSSLSYLHRLSVDSIKLDKSFVQSVDTDQIAHRLVKAMIGVAHGLGLNVVAEGVESEGQREALLAAGCSLMQGFLFARPQPASDLEEFLGAGAGDRTVGSSLEQLKAAMRMNDQLISEPVLT